ncbi:hypothetical protein EV182_000618 [Spiromyces aspiralis]|uniref:Uncharacterized protein n=1 Tax=Spiromyces aspiralis TaxID=68401 RepID=A0ACC1HVR3_9FUNG|nr:hypothetical protein EV182_000618 [Spiromyces aspiralis]
METSANTPSIDTACSVTSLLPVPRVEIRTHSLKGRGVYAVERIPKGTLVSTSPILLFPHKEYAEHGRFTRLDDYTYTWPGGQALALGLGSIFNHEPIGYENIGFVRDIDAQVINYWSLRDIESGEELCICYGAHVWFEDHSEGSKDRRSPQGTQAATAAQGHRDSSSENSPFLALPSCDGLF